MKPIDNRAAGLSSAAQGRKRPAPQQAAFRATRPRRLLSSSPNQDSVASNPALPPELLREVVQWVTIDRPQHALPTLARLSRTSAALHHEVRARLQAAKELKAEQDEQSYKAHLLTVACFCQSRRRDHYGRWAAQEESLVGDPNTLWQRCEEHLRQTPRFDLSAVIDIRQVLNNASLILDLLPSMQRAHSVSLAGFLLINDALARLTLPLLRTLDTLDLGNPPSSLFLPLEMQLLNSRIADACEVAEGEPEIALPLTSLTVTHWRTPDLGANFAPTSAAADLSFLRKLPHLESFCFEMPQGYGQIAARGRFEERLITALGALPRLRELQLLVASDEVTRAVCTHLNKTLQSVRLQHESFTDTFVDKPTYAPDLSSFFCLESFAWRGRSKRPTWFEEFRLSHCLHLRSLELINISAGAQVDVASLNLLKLPRLQELRLSAFAADDRCLRALTGLSNLRVLCLYSGRLSDDAVSALVDLMKHNRLERLELAEWIEMTLEQFERLVDHFNPALKTLVFASIILNRHSNTEQYRIRTKMDKSSTKCVEVPRGMSNIEFRLHKPFQVNAARADEFIGQVAERFLR